MLTQFYSKHVILASPSTPPLIVKMTMLGAGREEKKTCTPLVLGYRSLVQATPSLQLAWVVKSWWTLGGLRQTGRGEVIQHCGLCWMVFTGSSLILDVQLKRGRGSCHSLGQSKKTPGKGHRRMKEHHISFRCFFYKEEEKWGGRGGVTAPLLWLLESLSWTGSWPMLA